MCVMQDMYNLFFIFYSWGPALSNTVKPGPDAETNVGPVRAVPDAETNVGPKLIGFKLIGLAIGKSAMKLEKNEMN